MMQRLIIRMYRILYGFTNTFFISLIIIDDVASHMEYRPYSV